MGRSLGSWIGKAALLLLLLAALYGVAMVYTAGQPVLAMGVLAVVGLAVYVYTSPRAYAYRYLFPGLAGIAIFVLLPLVYTIAIGFTNYSSKNLLTYDRATQYLLDETYRAEGDSYAFSLHADGQAYRIRLEDSQTGAVFVSSALALKKVETLKLEMHPFDQANIVLGEAVQLRELIKLQGALKAIAVVIPGGKQASMSGLREFAPVHKLYVKNPDGALVNQETSEVLRPNFTTGFYENAKGEQVQPGFKVNVGFSNFARIFTDPNFQEPFARIFGWTVVFSALTVVFTLSVGIILAVLLNWEALRFRGLYRTMLFLPYAVPGFISILVFKGLFNQSFGEINMILDALFGIKPAWFSDPFLAKVMILIVNTWLGYPYMMVLCMGLIKAIPSDLYEASAIAGAGPLTNFFKITVPLIVKPITPLLISAFAFNFNNFVLISLLTSGRPDFLDTKVPAGTTDLLVSYTYRIAFEDSGQNFGLAAAISTVIFILVAALSLANLRLTKVNQTEAR
ncbi:maltose/maltodextrin transport system permease protein [Chitinivorax tropicus]|uniref:Maltose/maltodextrin transport system permease protein n=1 Tax=Chitinivorax tropicus TaxID=714531 RepID=A0A840MIR8_9PROT|nr:maltose ABC transporter permease MalF [Chitinivorax tropicus]MBB5017089.1 maltose/maltodextrin transport system permease protein [Chitinivorax tropicus]